ncbi:translation elongation factor 4 [Patescibacteria group bacterium]|nr:translation elongation factor 4 [Patescibacteria group bacterium]
MDNKIRNFCIIAHIDHGKSTLADRLLEMTGTVEKRKMQAQYLDQLELERERGITIKMAPVRMRYKDYELNLIDTPGHSDFGYEVSRALQAVEGGVLLVDATQGIQAQTLANYRSAKNAGLAIIGAVNKVDLYPKDSPEVEKARRELAKLIGRNTEDILLVSGKTGAGVEGLLSAVISQVPPPKNGEGNVNRALIFDSFYDDHKGVIASVRVMGGRIRNHDDFALAAVKASGKLKEVGFFSPQMTPAEEIRTGEIGYVATGVKDTALLKIGDTFIANPPQGLDPKSVALHGYNEPHPVVYVSFYPEEAGDYDLLKRSLLKLHLNDSALTIEPDQNEVLGRGFKVGFLGRLHFEITAERLKREFDVGTVSTFPSVLYRVKTKEGWKTIVKPEELPEVCEEIEEPMVKITILVPAATLSAVFPIYGRFRLKNIQTSTLEDQAQIDAVMPLAELISDFDDQLKSLTSGFASMSYELAGYEKADIVRVDIAVAGDNVPGLSRFFPRATSETEGRRMAEKLKNTLPRQQFSQAIQAKIGSKIIAREDIPALRKELGNFGKNGGDRTRKMKLWAKQKRGKEKLLENARVVIPPHLFKELLKK